VHGRIHTKLCVCRYNVCRRAPSPLGSIGPWGRVEGELKTQKMGVVSFVLRTATISIFLSVAKYGSICRVQTLAHSGVEPSRSAKAFLQGGPKSPKNLEFFTISRLYVPISQKLLKIEACKQRTGKTSLWPRGFYRVGQKFGKKFKFLSISSLYVPYVSGTAKNRGLYKQRM